MSTKITIYKIKEITEVTNEAGEVSQSTSVISPEVVANIYATMSKPYTKMVTNEDGESVETTVTDTFNVSKFYPKYNASTMSYGVYGIEHPIIDNKTGTVREMTRVEAITYGYDSLADGEVIVGSVVETVKPTQTFIVAKWNGSEWVEGATATEVSAYKATIKAKYDALIDTYKAEVISEGISWNGHIQKLRVAIDIPLLTGTIMALNKRITNGETKPTKIWSFSSTDNNVEMSVDDFNEILTGADKFIEKCYVAERTLKARDANLELTIADFRSLLV